MFEKISEQKERLELIKQVKEKILKEIEERRLSENNYLKKLILSTEDDSEIQNEQNEIMGDLLKLKVAKEYILDKYSFNSETGRCEESDIITYQISLKYLKIFLLKDFNFADNIVKNFNLYSIQYISDKYIVTSNFVSIIELCILEQELNKIVED